MKIAKTGGAGEGLEWLQPDWPAPSNVKAASSTRLGGVSTGVFASLNLGRSTGDADAAVTENRRRLFAALGAPEPGWLHQVHGADVVRAPLTTPEPDADACHTTQAGVVCAVQTADCLPVLFCDAAGTAVAAAHAGWRGLNAGVLEQTVRAMALPPQNLMAWLGPAIGPSAFEVGEQVRAAFVAHDARAASAFTPAAVPQKFFADLYALARQRLHAAGVMRIYGGGLCTHSDPMRFFSYRRDGASGRMASFIWLPA